MQKKDIENFIKNYSLAVQQNFYKVREIVLHNLPNISEQADISAKMIAYTYGNKYNDIICVIFPSKKGLKLSFNRGTLLKNVNNILEGNAKTTRYIVINNESQIKSTAFKAILKNAIELYQQAH